jgi:hypothetical protein
LLCSLDIVVPFTTTTGAVTFDFAMPINYALLGVPVFEQLWARDARANATGIATTNGVKNRLKQ